MSAHVGLWHLADIPRATFYVRFLTQSGHRRLFIWPRVSLVRDISAIGCDRGSLCSLTRALLFITKCINGIHACRLLCRMVAKEATDRSGESHGEDKALDAYDGRPPRELGDHRTKKDSHYCP